MQVVTVIQSGLRPGHAAGGDGAPFLRQVFLHGAHQVEVAMGAREPSWRHGIRDEAGTAAVEYALLTGLIAGVAVAGISATGHRLDQLWRQTANAISRALPGSPVGGGVGDTGGCNGSNTCRRDGSRN
jgi:Flp pilus assembly pilin Flp